ncbi:MAG TPA: hypothetical protein VNU21_06935 [Usitatibacter sp.]|nr:hypothetical protein [Usitatibacter sp.]
MAYLVAFISAVASGLVFAVAARLLGVHSTAVLLGVAVIGGGLQLIFLIAWFLHHMRPDTPIPVDHDHATASNDFMNGA